MKSRKAKAGLHFPLSSKYYSPTKPSSWQYNKFTSFLTPTEAESGVGPGLSIGSVSLDDHPEGVDDARKETQLLRK